MRILTETLQAGLKAVAPVINPRSTLPVLECVHFSVSPGGAVLKGTQLMSTIVRKVGIIAETGERWEAAIPFAKFAALVGTLDGVDTNLTYDKTKLTLKLSSGNVKSTLKCMDAAEFPLMRLPEIGENGDSADMSGVIQAIGGVAYAAAKDNTRPTLAGVCVDFMAGKAVATDGYRIAIAEFDNVDTMGYPTVVIPSLSARHLRSAGINPAAAQIEIITNTIGEPTGIAVWDNGALWHSNLVSQTYVDYTVFEESVLLDGVVLGRDELVQALTTMLSAKKAGSDYLTIIQNGDNLIMFARGEELDTRTILPISRTMGNGITGQVSCNIDYLFGAIKSDQATEMSMSYLAGSNAVSKIILSGSYSHTIVPMNVQSRLEDLTIE